MESRSEALLTIRDLRICYNTPTGTIRAVNSLNMDIKKGEVVGIVGETGCGKSTLAHSIPRLLPQPPAEVAGGRIEFDGVDMLSLSKREVPKYRGTGISMIFQEPINSLNPSYRIFDQVVEAIKIRKTREAGKEVVTAVEPHNYETPGPEVSHPLREITATTRRNRFGDVEFNKRELRQEVIDFLSMVRINDPEHILRLYPHELSGGMRQRVMIAMALSEKPKLMIADEPTSALDVTIQAQVLSLMKDLIEEVRTSILFISHDLGVVAEIADRIGVMYAGYLVEIGPAEAVFRDPQHPYTQSLLRSFPHGYKKDGRLPTLKGAVPNLMKLPSGCPFRTRCEAATDICTTEMPRAAEVGKDHFVSCYHHGGAAS